MCLFICVFDPMLQKTYKNIWFGHFFLKNQKTYKNIWKNQLFQTHGEWFCSSVGWNPSSVGSLGGSSRFVFRFELVRQVRFGGSGGSSRFAISHAGPPPGQGPPGGQQSRQYDLTRQTRPAGHTGASPTGRGIMPCHREDASTCSI